MLAIAQGLEWLSDGWAWATYKVICFGGWLDIEKGWGTFRQEASNDHHK